jgi:hypothetical protein
MPKHLDKYVGRMVRLNQRIFSEISKRARVQGSPLENYFLVAQVSRQMRRLICYGADLRIVVGPSDVILI